MKKFLLPMAMLACLSTQVYAQADRGNGGNSVDVNGVPRLRDLIDNTVCSWVDGDVMVKNNPFINNVLQKLSTVDWYFADELKHEILDLNYCLTGKLVRINTEDLDSLVTTYSVKSKQAAIRLDRAVYINEEILNSMEPYDRAFLMIHESMHTYIAQNEEMRNLKVRSIVKAIESVYRGNIASTRSFHMQLKNNDVRFPLTVTDLAPYRDQVEYLLGDYDEKRETVLALQNIGTFFEKLEEIPRELLASWHRDLLKEDSVEKFVLQAIAHEDIIILKKILDSSTPAREITLGVIYSSEVALNSPAIRQLLSTGNTLSDFVNETLNRISPHKIMLNDEGRITVPGMDLLAVNIIFNAPFTSLIPLNRNEYASLRPELRTFVEVIAKSIRIHDEETLNKLVYNNPSFYEAFGSIELKQTLQAWQTFDVIQDLEKKTAIKKVDLLLNGFWEIVKEKIQSQIKAGEWETFVNKIDQQKLGYKIK